VKEEDSGVLLFSSGEFSSLLTALSSALLGIFVWEAEVIPQDQNSSACHRLPFCRRVCLGFPNAKVLLIKKSSRTENTHAQATAEPRQKSGGLAALGCAFSELEAVNKPRLRASIYTEYTITG